MTKPSTLLLLLFIGMQSFAQEHFYDFIYYGQGADPKAFYATEDYAIFTANTPQLGTELYVTDGTPAGTHLLKELNPGAGGFQLGQCITYGGYLWFEAYLNGKASIWYTDGTEAGTKKYFENWDNHSIDFYAFNGWLFYQSQISKDSFYVRRVDSTFAKDHIVARYAHSYQYAKSNFVSTDNYLYYGFNDQIYRLDKQFNSPTKYFERSTTSVGDIPYLYEYNNIIFWYMRNSSSKTDVYAGKEDPGYEKIVYTHYGYPYFSKTGGTGDYFFYALGDGDIYRFNTTNFNHELVKSSVEPYVTQRTTTFALYKGEVYFEGLASGNDYELWKTGTDNSKTVKVMNIANDTSSHPTAFTVVNKQLFFSAYTRTAGRELWVTNGNSASTKLSLDFMPGAKSSNMALQSVAFKDKLLTAAYNDTYGMEVWLTDGTEAGTELLLDVNKAVDYGNQQVSTFMPAGDYLYLFANDSINGAELWRTDGSSEGTIFLDNINPGFLPSAMSEYITYRNELYGTAVSFAEGIELYASDGTPKGSFFVTPSNIFSSSAPRNYVTKGEYLYFIANQGFLGTVAIMRSNGTKAGTKPYLANGSDVKSVDNLTRIGNRMVVSVGTDKGHTAYFVDTDKDQLTPISSQLAQYPHTFFKGDDTLLVYQSYDLSGTTGLHYVRHGKENWKLLPTGLDQYKKSDTMLLTPKLLYLLHYDAKGNQRVASLTVHDKKPAVDGLQPADEYTKVQAIAALGNKVVFSAMHPSLGQELYITDGTNNGTVLLSDINPGAASSAPDDFFVYKDQLIFSATTADKGREVWITDGTTSGTHLLYDIYEGSGSSNPYEYSFYKGYLYVAASDSLRTKSLYRKLLDSCGALAPKLSSNKNRTLLCDRQIIKLKAATETPHSGINWYYNGQLLAEKTDSLMATKAGTYYFEATTAQCSEVSNRIEISDAPTINFKLDIVGDTAFCEGKSTNFGILSADATSVTWYLDEVKYSTQAQTNTNKAGSYYAVMKNAYGCSDTSRILQIVVYSKPVPQVLLRNDSLICITPASSYQWYFKGDKMEGETNSYLAPQEKGQYKVVLVSEHGCVGESEQIKFDNTGTASVDRAFGLHAYPNPFGQTTRISYSLPNNAQVQLRLYNELGQLVQTLYSGQQSAGRQQLDLSTTQSGVYWLQLQANDQQQVLRLVRVE
ncbi:T9SS type A sorting domain-containing protein [bacterium]|nr:T9SS type A sorting domain-containing protein [bacterium]